MPTPLLIGAASGLVSAALFGSAAGGALSSPAGAAPGTVACGSRARGGTTRADQSPVEAGNSSPSRRESRSSSVVAASGIPERTLKRRFKAATGSALMDSVQNLRIEEAKRLLETGSMASETIAAEVGYENPAFFRRLFKRLTTVTPGAYRRMFAREPARPPH